MKESLEMHIQSSEQRKSKGSGFYMSNMQDVACLFLNL